MVLLQFDMQILIIILDLYLAPYIATQWNVDLNKNTCKCRRKHEKNICDLGLGIRFSDMTPKASIKEKLIICTSSKWRTSLEILLQTELYSLWNLYVEALLLSVFEDGNLGSN